VWEWLADYTIRQDSTNWGYKNVLGAGMGRAYLPNDTGISALIAGGGWFNGVICGPRSVLLDSYPWVVSTLIGARLACDAA